ncbi:hypothetical protein MKZ38_009775 [Zalerion maritima]|uniref:Uncharacterized protein n=1 Tax=Zalerion maritima TaxID=339359 RepID=A0AAD5RY69_9PEZI|nr:hypothetical protein MKZ38_009775 [Zalerion maritima]
MPPSLMQSFISEIRHPNQLWNAAIKLQLWPTNLLFISRSHRITNDATPTFESRGPAKSQVSLASISSDHIRSISRDASPLCDSKIFDSQLSPTVKSDDP